MSTLKITDQSVKMAKDYEKQGIKPIDALHIAVTSENNIDHLCTCDDRFLRKANKIKNIVTKLLLPTDLVREVLT